MGNFDSIATTIKDIKAELNWENIVLKYIVIDKDDNIYVKSLLNSISKDEVKWMIVIGRPGVGYRWRTLALFDNFESLWMYVEYKNIKIQEIINLTGTMSSSDWKIIVQKGGKTFQKEFYCDDLHSLGVELTALLEELTSE